MTAWPLAALRELAALINQARGRVTLHELGQVQMVDGSLPLWGLTLGNPDPACPAVAYVGGVHGLERIGTEVVLAHLRSLIARLDWDATLLHQLEGLRVVFLPVANPGGMLRGTRANPHGVDLMRNAPVEARPPVPFLVGGQRLSAALPWYRGPAYAPMEPESQALCDFIRREMFGRPFSLAVDCHSGFGLRDRIWFPYAHTARPVEHLAELNALFEVFDHSLLHHAYVFEPQSRQYLTHGDLWDHLTLQARAAHPEQVFLALTLEMGSWLWVKKNPRQMFSRHGIFNPLIAHRQQRVLRRHLSWLDFVGRASFSHTHWRPRVDAERESHRQRALDRWYRHHVHTASSAHPGPTSRNPF